MQIRIIQQPLLQWLQQSYQYQLIQEKWQSTKKQQLSQLEIVHFKQLVKSIKILKNVQASVQQPKKLHYDYLAMAVQVDATAVVIAVQQYRDEAVIEFGKQYLYNYLLLRQNFPNNQLQLIYVLPQLAPKIVIEFEQVWQQCAQELTKVDQKIQVELLVQTIQHKSVSKTVSKQILASKIIEQLQSSIRAKKFSVTQVRLLQKRDYTKQHFNIDYPVLMTRTDYLKSQYERKLFCEKMVIVQGREYFVFQQWEVQAYRAFELWLQRYK
ncbi:MAG: hypothetical protein ACRCZC_00345 [Culicoidibacterales bacterium]